MRASQPLLVKFEVKWPGFSISEKGLRILPSAIETRPVARRKGCHLIEKEQRGVTPAHRLMMCALPFEFAANPMCAGPAPLAQRLVIAVKFAAAVAQHGALRRRGEDVTVWCDAVLQWHWI